MPRIGSRTDLRKRVWKKSDGICVACGAAVYGNHQTIDHFIPRSKGGGNDIDNLVPLCSSCNSLRRNRKIIPEEFYIYASDDVIRACKRYKRKWCNQHRSMDSYIHT